MTTCEPQMQAMGHKEKVKIKTNPMEEIERIISKHRSTLTLPKDGNYKKLIRELKYQDYLNSK